jgi:hypothetical protein
MAAALLPLERFEEAYEAAEEALLCDADKAKTLFRFTCIIDAACSSACYGRTPLTIQSLNHFQ